jgi:hypothetical protein
MPFTHADVNFLELAARVRGLAAQFTPEDPIINALRVNADNLTPPAPDNPFDTSQQRLAILNILRALNRLKNEGVEELINDLKSARSYLLTLPYTALNILAAEAKNFGEQCDRKNKETITKYVNNMVSSDPRQRKLAVFECSGSITEA